jgi:hypothetical protein
VAVVVCIACLVPFAGKAFYIDDPLFLWAAEQIQKHPGDPYGFDVHWYRKTDRMADVTKNPPLACYVLALAASIFGWSEAALHLVLLLPAAGVAWGTYRLAEGLCTRPLLATLIGILTPVFLVSSTNVMCDTLMLCLWVWAIVYWRRGLERPALLAVASVLTILCALTKYFGVSLIPLLLAYTLSVQGLVWRRLAPLLLPVAVLVAYQELTRWQYGQGLVSDAAGFAMGWRFYYGEALFAPILGLIFTGGCLASVLFYIPLLLPWRTPFAGLALLGGACGVVAVLSPALRLGRIGDFPVVDKDGWNWSVLAQASVWLLGGIAVLALAIADLCLNYRRPSGGSEDVAKGERRRNGDALLLFLWCAGTLIFSIQFNWVINGRSLLPLAPAVGILVARRLDLLRGPCVGTIAGRELIPLVPAAMLALVVTAADARQAESDKVAAEAMADRCAGQNGALRCEGHWGFQYYLQRRGGVPVTLENDRFASGDFLAIPDRNYGNDFEPPAGATRSILTMEPAPFPGLTTMSKDPAAGFYSHEWGPLPFAFGRTRPVPYRLLQFVEPATTDSH